MGKQLIPQAAPLPESTHTPLPLRSFVKQNALLGTVLGVLLCTALYLWVRPYYGLRHDAQLYLGQTILQSDPQGLVHDLFFAHGSQDRYSVVSWILDALYRMGGLALSQFFILLIAQIALLAAAYRWMARHVSGHELWMGFVMLIVMQRLYGGYAIFAFGERFVTARTFAEPLIAWSLVLLAERRWTWAAGAWLLGAMAHPLMALPVLVIAWVRAVMDDRRWCWALLLVVPVLVLAVIGLQPFAGLFRVYDDSWWYWIERVSRHVLASEWTPVDYMNLLGDGLVLAAAHHYLAFHRRWWAAVLLATGLLTLCSILLGDLAKLQLVVQLQLWRAHWIAHLLALLCLPSVVMTLWRLQGSARVAALALLAAVIGANSRSNETWPMLIWAALWLLAASRSWRPSTERMWLLGSVASVLMIVVGGIQGVLVNLEALGTPGLRMLGEPPAVLVLLILSTPIVALPATLLILRAAKAARGVYAAVVLGLLIAVGTGAAEWDRRPGWTRFIEENFGRLHPWQELIPVDAQVYWHPNSLPTWALLRRASFVSFEQGAGLLFNRATAMDYGSRVGALERLSFQAKICEVIAALPGGTDEDFKVCFPTEKLLRHVCNAKPAPDYLIFDKRMSLGWLSEWTALDPHGKPLHTYHLYQCAAYRH